MNTENEELLLKDLCARLPYGVVIKEEYGDYINVNLHNANIEHLIDRISEGLDKLVLRPMSSMTEEEHKEWFKQSKVEYDCEFHTEPILSLENCHLSTDWLNRYHFDYRGLIPMGLALEVPEGMYQ